VNKLATIDTKNAKLPVSYEHAKTALGECYKLDECKEWKDKAAALASYAKQAHDETLYKTAMKIQGRALRRYGELRALIPEEQSNGRPSNKSCLGGHDLSARQQADEAAGMSVKQATTAMRVASIPEEEFEAAIEADDTPTITKLAEMGTKKRDPPPEPPAYLKGRTPEEFNAAIHARAQVRDMAQRCCGTISPEVLVAVSTDDEKTNLKTWLAVVIPWLDTLHTEIYK
jgi:hypothetical protein